MSTRPNFNRVARIYRWAEYLTLGPILQRTRTYFLPQLADRRKALLFGDGDGRFLARLLEQNPALQATAVDISATMLHLLRQRCTSAASLLLTLHASALEINIPQATDLVVTHFFLDCLTQAEVDTLVQNVAANAASGTLWLVSDFQIPQHTFIRPIAAMYIRSLYLAFRILTGLRVQSLPNPQAALRLTGFTRIGHHETLFGLIYTEIWQHQ
jgi:ubiquinone/menaquinone biosynthesis C-methylase UbiE